MDERPQGTPQDLEQGTPQDRLTGDEPGEREERADSPQGDLGAGEEFGADSAVDAAREGG